MTLNEFCKRKRMKLGISQAVVAKKLGYASAQFISNFERGECKLPDNKLKKIGETLKIKPEILVLTLVGEYRKEIKKVLKLK